MDHLLDDMIVENPVRNDEKYLKYLNAVLKAKQFFEPDRGTCMYTNPDDTYDCHQLFIKLANDEFDGDEVATLTEIIGEFDGLMFIGSEKGDISIQLLMDNIYTEGKP